MRPARISLALLLAAASGCAEVTSDPDDVGDPDAPMVAGAAPPASPAVDVMRARAEELLQARSPALVTGGELIAARVSTSGAGIQHHRFQQAMDGVPVRGGEAIVHLHADGRLRGMTDALVPELAVDTQPALNADEAVEIAAGGAAVISTPELQIARRDDGDHLVWRVELEDSEVLVDAHDGAIVGWNSTVETVTGASHYDGTQSFNTFHDGSRYWLEDTTRRLLTLSAGGDDSVSTSNADGISDADNVWNAPRSIQVHASMRRVYDYFNTVHQWRGMNGTGGATYATGASGQAMITSAIDWVDDDDGANYAALRGGRLMVFGHGDGTNYGFFGALDVVAHEWMHGVSNFGQEGEANHLDEHFSDVFAAAIERWAGGTRQASYRLGEDVKTPNSANNVGVTWDASQWDAIRYMWDPRLDGDSLDYYTTTLGDLADPHEGTGVGNLAFYLVSEGGAHPRRSGGPAVTAIGIDAASKIWFAALRDYLTSTATYHSLRVATLEAAADRYGAGSTQYRSVWNAWRAVGVGVSSEDCPGYDHIAWHTISPGQARDLPATGAILSDDGSVASLVHDPLSRNVDVRLFRYDWSVPGWVPSGSSLSTSPSDWVAAQTGTATWYTWVVTNTTSSSFSFPFCYSD